MIPNARIMDMCLVIAMRRSRRRTSALLGLTCLIPFLFSQAACSGESPVEYSTEDGLRFSAAAEMVADSVAHTLSVFNTSDASITLETSCEHAGGVLIARGSDQEVSWSELESLRQQGCFPVVDTIEVPVGEKVELRRTVPIEQILGDSLVAGNYGLFVRVSFVRVFPEWEIPVGVHELNP